MSTLLHTLREYILPSRPSARRGAGLRDSLATPIALLLVAIVAGPDLFVYVELSTILDLLGAALFLFAFAMGFRLLLLSTASQLRFIFASEDLILLARCPAPNPLRAIWIGLIALRAFRVCVAIAISLLGLALILVSILGRL
jgi:hypothetical protein